MIQNKAAEEKTSDYFSQVLAQENNEVRGDLQPGAHITQHKASPISTQLGAGFLLFEKYKPFRHHGRGT